MRKSVYHIFISLVACASVMSFARCGRGDSKSASSDSSVQVSEVSPGKADSSAAAETTIPNLPTMIDFYATWCGPCKAISPLVDSLQRQYEGKMNVVRVDVDENPGKASAYGISSIPTFVFLNKDGKEMTRLVGAEPDALTAMASSLTGD